MLTVKEIQDKVNTFPKEGSVESLLEELVLLYRTEQSLRDIERGDLKDWEEFKKEMDVWVRSK